MSSETLSSEAPSSGASSSESEVLPRRVVLGLGNPGPRYAATRHNLGFRVVNELARRRRIDLVEHVCNARWGHDDALVLVAPETYMNRSGYTARCLVERYGFEPAELLVVYDEIHLPLGRLRLRRGGSPAGHRGMESVIENLESGEIPRLKMGIAPEAGLPPGPELPDFVLAAFADDEKDLVEEMVQGAASACEAWLDRGLEAAMQAWNG